MAGSSMLIGFNNDVEFKGRMFHIQTEDHGLKDGHITTILFFNGQTLDSKKVDYRGDLEGVTDDDDKRKAVKKRMVALHREFYKKLFDGNYEEQVEAMVAVRTSQNGIKKSPPPLKTRNSDSNNPKLQRKPPPPPRIPKRAVNTKTCYRGIIWPDTLDLSLDGLVRDFLATQS